MAADPPVLALQKVLATEPQPTLPNWDATWDLNKYRLEIEAWNRKLLEYLRRLFARLSTVVIEQTFVGVIDWQYDAATNKFQVKRSAAPNTWVDATGDQPTQATELSEWHYNATTHKFQYKTQLLNVLVAATASAYTNAPADQPVLMSTVIEDVDYNTTSHILSEDIRADVYVLEMGSQTNNNLVDQAGPCGS